MDRSPPSSEGGTQHPHVVFGCCSEFPAFPRVSPQAEFEKMQQGSPSLAIKLWWLESGVPILATHFALQST